MAEEKYNGNIAILFTESAKCDKERPFESRYWSRAYSIFSKKAYEHGLKLFFAHYKEFADGRLKNAWARNKNRWIKVKDQEVGLVYSRFAKTMFMDNKENKKAIRLKYKMAEQVSLVNHPLIDKFCWDKRFVSELFPEYCPKTFLVNTLKGLKTVLPEIRSKKVVIKPRYGTLGQDVFIIDRDKLPKKIEKNTIVQEFVNTSKGIKGVIGKTHDLRLIMINGKIDHAHIRVPKRGLFAANVALGGKKIFIKNGQVPKKAVRIAKKIDRLFRHIKPRVYSIDFLIDEGGRAFIVECNSQPMIDKYACGKYACLEFYDRLLETMKEGIKIKVVETI